MTIVPPGRKTAMDDINPAGTVEGLPQKRNGCRVGLRYHALAIQNDNAGRQCVQQGGQTICQLLFFFKLLLTLERFLVQLAGKLVDPGFEGPVGVSDLPRHPVEQFQGGIHRLIVLFRKQGGNLVIDVRRSVGLCTARAGLKNKLCLTHNLTPRSARRFGPHSSDTSFAGL